MKIGPEELAKMRVGINLDIPGDAFATLTGMSGGTYEKHKRGARAYMSGKPMKEISRTCFRGSSEEAVLGKLKALGCSMRPEHAEEDDSPQLDIEAVVEEAVREVLKRMQAASAGTGA